MWNEFLPISMRFLQSQSMLSQAWRAPRLGAPGEFIAGGAGARPDHPITGHCRCFALITRVFDVTAWSTLPSYVDILTCLQLTQDVEAQNVPTRGASKRRQ